MLGHKNGSLLSYFVDRWAICRLAGDFGIQGIYIVLSFDLEIRRGGSCPIGCFPIKRGGEFRYACDWLIKTIGNFRETVLRKRSKIPIKGEITDVGQRVGTWDKGNYSAMGRL